MIIKLTDRCPFDLDFTLCCGQTFRWEERGEWWYGVIRNTVLRTRQRSSGLEFENADEALVRHYFGLNDDLRKILFEINKDENIEQAIANLKGLRLLHQDPWESLISFICATYKNVPAIKQMILKLANQFGEDVFLGELEFHTFPTPARLAEGTLKELEECGLGYRAKYVSETARIVRDNNTLLRDLAKADYCEAKAKLLELPGVGPKVADCVLLFSLDKTEAFPIDIWIKRAIVRYYPTFFPKEFVHKIKEQKSLSIFEYEKISLFGRRYFGKYAGYAQEYIYHNERLKH